MKFYVVFGVLAALALHVIADETKDSVPATVSAAIDRATAVTKATISNDNSKHSFSDNNILHLLDTYLLYFIILCFKRFSLTIYAFDNTVNDRIKRFVTKRFII